MTATFKLTIYAPSGKINAIYLFGTRLEVDNLIFLNQVPRYELSA
jgi:hypothetical protein